VTRPAEPSDRSPGGPRPALAGEITGIVLAGGASRRFGSDKLNADLDGRPLLRHAVDALARRAGSMVVAVQPGPPPGLGDPPPAVPVRFVEDPVPDGGPLVGLAAGLEATTTVTALVIGGDMPSVPASVLDLLLDRLGTGADAAILLDEGAPRPLPMAVRVAAARSAARLALGQGRRSLLAMLDELRTEAIPEVAWRSVDPAGDALRDVDRPADMGSGRPS
jgi:molybdopterin-guanine dinucleotide biosynthesis protein A